MDGLVNSYFKKFYPENLDRLEDFSFDGMERCTKNVSTIFPRMVCADGFNMSVQGNYGGYSTPRDDFADNYSEVEVGYPSEREELLMPFIDGGPDTDPTKAVYAYVPVEIIAEVVAKHGGLKEAPNEEAMKSSEAVGHTALRDLFAMHALTGCLAYSHHNEAWGDFQNNYSNEGLASHCYNIADAMLKARNAALALTVKS